MNLVHTYLYIIHTNLICYLSKRDKVHIFIASRSVLIRNSVVRILLPFITTSKGTPVTCEMYGRCCNNINFAESFDEMAVQRNRLGPVFSC